MSDRVRRLLGPDGEPIEATIQQLREEVADARGGGPVPVRQLWPGHPADGITPARLARIMRAADNGDSMAYQELAEEIEERDLHYAGVLGTRKRSVAQLPVIVEAASDDAEAVRHADFVREWLAGGVLQAALFDILDGVAKGFSVHEIVWQTEPGAILPQRLVYRPQRWFEVDQDDGETLLLRDAAGMLPLSRPKFVIHRHPNKSGQVMRSGVARVAAWAWLYKAFTLKDWAIFVQNYGQPIRVGRYGPEAGSEDRKVLWSAVANIAGDCAAIIPRGMEIEFVEVGNLAEGSKLYRERCDFLDQQMSKLILGQVATTDAIAGGHAVGREHRQVQEDIERFDAGLLTATINRDLVRPIVAYNFGPQARYPTLRIGRPDDVPLAEIVDTLHKLGPLGMGVEASWLRDKIGAPDPAVDAEIVGGRAPVPAQPPPVPPQPALNTLHRLVARHAVDPAGDDMVAALSARLAHDAAGALAGMTQEVRAAVDGATDLHDLAARLAALKLDTQAFAAAMGRGLVLAQLAGQAALLDEIGHRGAGA